MNGKIYNMHTNEGKTKIIPTYYRVFHNECYF